MGWQFRKSIKVAPGVRINLSKRGVGASVGAGGLRYTLSPGRKAKSKTRVQAAPQERHTYGFGSLLIGVVIVGWLIWWAGGGRR